MLCRSDSVLVGEAHHFPQADPEVDYVLALEAKLEATERANESIFTESDISAYIPQLEEQIAALKDVQQFVQAELAAMTYDFGIEIDSSTNVFGILYRVWKGMKLLGTFYRSPVDEKWVAEPFCGKDRNCELIEFNGEADHVHLIFQYYPQMQLSKFINSLKSYTSQTIRQEFPVEVKRVYWRQAVF